MYVPTKQCLDHAEQESKKTQSAVYVPDRPVTLKRVKITKPCTNQEGRKETLGSTSAETIEAY